MATVDPNHAHAEQLVQATWHHWPIPCSRCPSIIEPLTGGLTNQSFIVETHCQEFSRVVLRLFSPLDMRYRINRQQELAIHQATAEAHISPSIVYWDNSLKFSVVEFYSGRTWTSSDWQDAEQQAKLAEVIKLYQTLDLSHLPAFNYGEHLRHYQQQLRQNLPEHDKYELEKFLKALEAYNKSDAHRTLTHHDLRPENVIEFGDNIKIIDWEYAGLGFGDLDKASLDNSSSPALIKTLNYWLSTLWHQI